jgi:hypothetical protein
VTNFAGGPHSAASKLQSQSSYAFLALNVAAAL